MSQSEAAAVVGDPSQADNKQAHQIEISSVSDNSQVVEGVQKSKQAAEESAAGSKLLKPD